MKIEKNSDGNGFVLTNSAGDSLNVSFMEFWDICRAGTEIDTKSEVEEYLSQCSDISGHDLDRIRAFPKLVDKITEQVIQDRINDESGDQIYYAAEKCIKDHLSTLEESLDMMKWFELSEDKCISVWYGADKYDGDQFQMLLEQKGKGGSMGFGCEVLSSDSYATADISFEALCETLNEICDDADVFVEDETAQSNLVSKIAKNIFSEFGMEVANKELLEEEKTSLDEKITIANNQKSEIYFAGYPSLEKIKSDYKELMEMIKDVRTVEAAKELSDNNSIFVEINGVSIDEFLRDGGTNQDIEWIRYEAYGCLSYVYDRFDGKPMFDVGVGEIEDREYEFITDITIDDLTKENYTKWVNEDRGTSSPTRDEGLEM